MASQESIHDIPMLINQFLATADDESLVYKRFSRELAQLIANGELSLLQFIQNLGSSLTSDNDLIRIKSVQCMTSTFQDLDKSKLSKQDIHVVLQFFIAKFDDKVCLIHILQGLNSIILFNNFIPSINGNYNLLLTTLLEKYDPKKSLAKIRYEPFQILKTLFNNHLKYIQSKPADQDLFVKAFIHIASGEKDPRNLLASFDLNSDINQHLSFDPQNELHEEFITDLFDVCFCYFPIAFTPPANDPYKITANDLKVHLRNTISSQSLFAKDSFPSLIEKLTSTNPTVRNDVLKTLLLCVQNYNNETLLQYWLTIWDSLKFEILHNEAVVFNPTLNIIIPNDFESKIDDSDENKSLLFTLQILMELANVMNQENQLENYLSTVTEELKKNLKSINDKTFKQSVVLLSSLASVSSESFNFILKFLFSAQVWGKLIRSDVDEKMDIEEVPSKQETEIDINEVDQKQSEDVVFNVSKQRELIENFGFVLSAYHILSHKDSSFASGGNNLKLYKDHLLIFLGQLLQTSSNIEKTLKCKVIQQLIKLTLLHGLLNNQDYSLIFGWLNDILSNSIDYSVTNWEKDMVLTEIINGLVKCMTDEHGPAKIENAHATETSLTNNITLVIDLILPTLLALLDNVQSDDEMVNFSKILKIIDTLCVNYQFLDVLTVRLLNKLSQFNQLTLSTDSKLFIFKEIIDCFISSFKKTQSVNQFLTNSWYKNFVPRFLNVVLQSDDKTVIELSGVLIGLIIKYIDKSKHQSILNDFVGCFLLNQSNLNINVPGVTQQVSTYIGLFNNILSSVDRKTNFEEALGYSIFNLIDNISKFAYSSFNEDIDEYYRIGYLQNLSILVNKFTKQNDETNGERISQLVFEIEKFNNSNTELTKNQIETFEIFTWILKALVLRSDRYGFQYTDKLIDWLNSSNLLFAQIVSEAFYIIMIDLPIFTTQSVVVPGQKSVISGVSNLNVRLLYKQQLFEIILPKLISGYEAGKNQEIYLNSLSIILNNISTAILKPHLNEISPLVLKSLNINNSLILEASLSTFEIIISESPDTVTPHLSNIIPKLLSLVSSKKVINKQLINTEKIRLLALKSLMGIFTSIDLPNVIPYQKSAINKLEIALDDKKRVVRKYASDVRQVLYELGRS
ncbi:ARM repeat-containing protein [Hyphopichia burtonii NRRL Y-1933]|uniref:MMS19 nucleotide excision repair protein n=1 Tax=Hyphopichia burtonii NRRL Y-1933 TaxID=984485 RepID=A0A1E4RI98_9ASCO|nr:ARM repeat-containing protein [Hyphopichia burtonii NRRL Y-1933]ODV66994.1 ARM repeat-containing protein [Hyphopichia burtonii NRRL Y-1933]